MKEFSDISTVIPEKKKEANDMSLKLPQPIV